MVGAVTTYRPTNPQTGLPSVDRAILQVNDAVQDALRSPLQCPLLGGVKLDVAIGTSDTVIPHTLDRQPLGWFIVDSLTVGAVSVRRVAWDERTITLLATAAFTGSVWVF